MAALVINESYAHRALVMAASLARSLDSVKITCSAAVRAASFTLGTQVLHERPAIALALVQGDARLSGRTPAAKAKVYEWLSSCDAGGAASEERLLERLNDTLSRDSYVAGAAFTLADAFVYYTLHPLLKGCAAGGKLSGMQPVLRWLDQVMHEPDYPLATLPGAPAPITLPSTMTPPLASLMAPVVTAAVASPASEAATAAAGGKSEKKAKAAAATAAVVEAAAPAVASDAAGAPVAPTPGDKPAKKAGDKKATSAPAPAPAAAAAVAGDSMGCVDLRVGKIVKVWHHETAERLFCEEIDVGEATGPRRIASGLREHYSLEQMENRMVVVVCNLPPRPLQGFESNGMVLAATSAAGKVELLDVPAGARVGERVIVPGFEGEVASANVMKKKKHFDVAAEALKVDDKLQATYKGVPLTTSAGVITVPSTAGGSIH